MSVGYADLRELEGKKVILVRMARDSDGNEIHASIEGKLDAAAEVGVLLKPRGRQIADIIPLAEIVSVEALATSTRKVQQKLLKEVDIDTARAHLADRHAFTLSNVNSMTPTDALAAHEAFEHADLGHRHGDREAEEELALEEEAEAAVE